jgi:GTP-binding protein
VFPARARLRPSLPFAPAMSTSPSPKPVQRPVVALLGVPNAGKSTLFNRLLGERRALVTDIPGTTRDRIYGRWRAEGKACLLCDTGGFVGNAERPRGRDARASREPDGFGPVAMQEEIERQTFVAVHEAHVVVLVLDGRAGLTAGERELAARLRPIASRVLLVWNKMDDPRREDDASEAFELGLGEPIPLSAEHGIGVADLAEAIAARLPEDTAHIPLDDGEEIRVAIVGRPNVGKSSLLNRLVGAERVTVAAEPGTTRDTVDTDITRSGRVYRFLDTAGIRRPSRVTGDVERLGILMAKRAIARADVALCLFDASEGIVAQDLTVAGLVVDSGRGAILVGNKWDLVEDRAEAFKELKKDADARLRFSKWSPFVTISALEGQRVDNVFDLIDRVHAAGDVTIPTPRLNRFLTDFRAGYDNVTRGPKLRYLTQVGVRPPTFLAFGPAAGLLHFSEVRRLENRIREEFDIGPTPIRIRFRRDEARKARGEARKRPRSARKQHT